MPRRDGTGPMGLAANSGRGLGLCPERKAIRDGIGLGMGNGMGLRRNRNVVKIQTNSITQKQLLQVEKELLESKLDSISKQLESL